MKKQSGCMTAFWIVVAIFGVVALFHIAVFLYLYNKKFQPHVDEETPSISAPVDSSASASPA